VTGPLLIPGWLAVPAAAAVTRCAAGPADASSPGSPAAWGGWPGLIIAASLIGDTISPLASQPDRE